MKEALESITVNPTHDFCFLGTTSGAIYTISMSIAAMNVTTHQSNPVTTTSAISMPTSQSSSNSSTNINNVQSLDQSQTDTTPNTVVRTLFGHSRIVTSLSMSLDNSTLVSTSDDGSVRFWDIWTGQV